LIWLIAICAVAALVFVAVYYEPVRTIRSATFHHPPIVQPSKNSENVTALVFNTEDELADRPFCDYLVAGTARGEVRVFDIPTSSLVESFKGLLPPTAPITALSIGPVWDYDTESQQEQYHCEYLAVAQKTRASVLSWNVRLPAGRRLLAFSSVDDAPGGGPLQDLSYDCSGDSLWAFDIGSQSACQWECSTGKLIHAEARPAGLPAVRSIFRSINGRYTVLEYSTGGIEVFDAWGATGGATDYGLPVYKSGDGGGAPLSALAVSSLGCVASTGGAAGAWYVELTDFVGAAPSLKLPTADELTALAFGYQGDLLAGGGPGYVILWNARSGAEQCRLKVR
jgi:WD40 repeat protein